MILILVAVVAFFVLRSGAIPGASGSDGGISPVPSGPTPRPIPTMTPVVRQSTGSSLSQALGNANRSPRYYASGNPGTSITPPSSSSILFAAPKWSAPPIQRTVSNPFHGGAVAQPTQNNPSATVKTTETTAVGVKRVSSALVNPSQTLRPVVKPEWPAAFWTRRV